MNRYDPKVVKISADTVREFTPGQVAKIAERANPGDLVYAPPIVVVPPRRRRERTARLPVKDLDGQAMERAPRPRPPDMTPLRTALAARGLALEEADGPFYWRCVLVTTWPGAGSRPAPKALQTSRQGTR